MIIYKNCDSIEEVIESLILYLDRNLKARGDHSWSQRILRIDSWFPMDEVQHLRGVDIFDWENTEEEHDFWADVQDNLRGLGNIKTKVVREEPKDFTQTIEFVLSKPIPFDEVS